MRDNLGAADKGSADKASRAIKLKASSIMRDVFGLDGFRMSPAECGPCLFLVPQPVSLSSEINMVMRQLVYAVLLTVPQLSVGRPLLFPVRTTVRVSDPQLQLNRTERRECQVVRAVGSYSREHSGDCVFARRDVFPH